MGDLEVPQGKTAAYAQLYLTDTVHERELRLQGNDRLQESVVADIQEAISRENPYVKDLKQAMELFTAEPESGVAPAQFIILNDPSGTECLPFTFPL